MKFHATAPEVAGTLLLGLAAAVAADSTATGSSWTMGSAISLARRDPLWGRSKSAPAPVGGAQDRQSSMKFSFRKAKSSPLPETAPHKHMTTGNKEHDEKVKGMLSQLSHMCSELPNVVGTMPAGWLLDKRTSTRLLTRREQYLRNAYWVRALHIEYLYKGKPEDLAPLRCWNQMSGIAAMSENKVTMDGMIQERRRKACHQAGHAVVATGAGIASGACFLASAAVFVGTFATFWPVAVGISSVGMGPIAVAGAVQPKSASSKGGRNAVADVKDKHPRDTRAGCKDGPGAFRCWDVLGEKPKEAILPSWMEEKK